VGFVNTLMSRKQGKLLQNSPRAERKEDDPLHI